ncbi:maleylpyruvate isomerase N-terminal domain-containing protein [Auraticoccus monumenti]|uniref:TIGR03083 family protein n=1 Tax=Auraticoccus monumenti TaxID=675864 RepID=A0A1G7D385_9ACTN|nr:maleylpyruvate isomerase N-terminal domain-containing protein [Auraticoccus monumenti]SDE45426.1 TIGR03083 family protein [Auraticoccus monumenti]
MSLTIDLDTARQACVESVHGFVAGVDRLSEHDLLGPSRCHGWQRLDVVVHVLAGWQEMLGGMVARVDDAPDVDAASYWPSFAEAYGGGDPVAELMAQRRRSLVFTRPDDAREQLRDVAASLLRGVGVMPDQPVRWQRWVFGAGDFLAVWAVEHAVHHLDLATGDQPPATALELARRTLEALLGQPLPTTLDDEEAVLVGTGRSPVPPELEGLADRFPLLG